MVVSDEPATLDCDHCGGVAIESPDGKFGDDEGERCASCGFPGSIVVSGCEDDEGEPEPAYWSTSDKTTDKCTRPGCEDCEEPSMFTGRDQVAQSKAKRWVYSCIASALENSIEANSGWFFPGEHASESDKVRIKRAIVVVRRKMLDMSRGVR